MDSCWKDSKELSSLSRNPKTVVTVPRRMPVKNKFSTSPTHYSLSSVPPDLFTAALLTTLPALPTTALINVLPYLLTAALSSVLPLLPSAALWRILPHLPTAVLSYVIPLLPTAASSSVLPHLLTIALCTLTTPHCCNTQQSAVNGVAVQRGSCISLWLLALCFNLCR